MVLDTLLSTSMMIVVGIFGWKTYTMPKSFPKPDSFVGKRLLLTMLCLVFGGRDRLQDLLPGVALPAQPLPCHHND